MPDELQSLLDRIHNEGIKKTEEEKNAIILQAKHDAAEIIKNAKQEAFEVLKTSRIEASKNESKAKETIRQAARDITILLEKELMNRLTHCIKAATERALDAKLIGQIIIKMVEYYKEQHSDIDLSLELVLSQQEDENLIKSAITSLSEDIKSNPIIFKDSNITSGFRLGFTGNDLFFDFTDDTITELICNYIGTKLTAILKGDKQ